MNIIHIEQQPKYKMSPLSPPLFYKQSIASSTKQIILIRHAEKNYNESVHLSRKGNTRAHYLIDYFLHPVGEFRMPCSIYAMKQSRQDSSNRCFETVKDIASILNIQINHDFARYDINDLAKRIQEDTSDTILICWEHVMIPQITRLLGFQVHTWGFMPLSLEDEHDCYSATWVLEGKDMNVYHQFEIDDNLDKFFPFPRNISVFHESNQDFDEKNTKAVIGGCSYIFCMFLPFRCMWSTFFIKKCTKFSNVYVNKAITGSKNEIFDSRKWSLHDGMVDEE